MKEIIPIYLKDKDFFASGGNREVYFHPRYKDRCVKVLAKNKSNIGQEHFRKQSIKEAKYLCKYQKKGIHIRHFSLYFGTVPTNKGKGYVFQLIRNYDGTISQTLEEYLKDKKKNFKEIQTYLEELKYFLFNKNVCVRELFSKNVLVCKESPQNTLFIIVDGIGNNEFIKTCDYINWFRKRKIKRKWDIFEKELKLLCKNN